MSGLLEQRDADHRFDVYKVRSVVYKNSVMKVIEKKLNETSRKVTETLIHFHYQNKMVLV